MNVCIVGAGTAGLCAARHVLANNSCAVVFEQTETIGGTWVYTDETGTNAFGINVHSSMYEDLRTNLPKEVMGFPDFPILKPDDESYITSESICNFLDAYADHFKLRKCIKFLHQVIGITPSGDDDKWRVTVRDLLGGRLEVLYFDCVMICSGHYHTPQYPSMRGREIFKGQQIHSHDFRSGYLFQDKRVLIVGAGPSGMDLCLKISEHAAHVTLSHHLSQIPRTEYSSNVVQKPDVQELDERGARFEDGSYAYFDIVFYCTGYRYTFPFLNDACQIRVEDNYVQSLYKHCINIAHPSMAFIGLPFYVCAAQMMDLQVRFIMKFWTGEKMLPSVNKMRNETQLEMEARWGSGYKRRQAHMMGPEQHQYYTDLADTAGVENIPPVMTKLHNESSQRFLDDLAHFREDKFKILDDETFIKL